MSEMKVGSLAHQQGDTLFFVIDSVPAGERKAIPLMGGQIVVAHGESGHMHAIADIEGADFFEVNGKQYLVAKRKVTLGQEEHKPHTIMPGTYEFRKVRDYNHFDEEAREVAD